MAKVKDPVCGMEFDSSQAEAQTVYQGQAYYFCSEECRRTFEEDPKEFVGNTASRDSGETSPPLRG
jgi:Cu+-exporting ATPase